MTGIEEILKVIEPYGINIKFSLLCCGHNAHDKEHKKERKKSSHSYDIFTIIDYFSLCTANIGNLFHKNAIKTKKSKLFLLSSDKI